MLPSIATAATLIQLARDGFPWQEQGWKRLADAALHPRQMRVCMNGSLEPMRRDSSTPFFVGDHPCRVTQQGLGLPASEMPSSAAAKRATGAR